MPNIKIFVGDTLYPGLREPLLQALGPIRQMLCNELSVDVPACQFAVMPVAAMPDLPRINVEMAILPREDRTRERVTEIGNRLRQMVQDATGTHVAVRVAALDPASYVAL